MPSRRLVILLMLLAAAFAALLAAAPGGRHHHPAGAPAVAATAAGAAGVAGTEAAAGAGAAPGTAAAAGAGAPWRLDGQARLEAVRTVKLFCDLVDARLYWPAAGLFAAQRVWTRAELRSVRALSFRSARVLTTPGPSTVTVVASALSSVRPGSPVPPGAVTLFFTLGRVGTATGGWVIEAVTARPQHHRKGSS